MFIDSGGPVKMARAQGFEPRLSGPEPDVLPLDDARTFFTNSGYDSFISLFCQAESPGGRPGWGSVFSMRVISGTARGTRLSSLRNNFV